MSASLLLRGHVIDNSLTVTEHRIDILLVSPKVGAKTKREKRARTYADEVQLQFA